jgi:hypothetical protein
MKTGTDSVAGRNGATVLGFMIPLSEGELLGVEVLWDAALSMWVVDFRDGYSRISEVSRQNAVEKQSRPSAVFGGAR